MRVQTYELVVRLVVLLQYCSAGVVVSRPQVVRCRRALGRRSQACPTVCSSVLVSFTFVQLLSRGDGRFGYI